MKYLLVKPCSKEFLVEGHTFTTELDKATRFTKEEAVKESTLLQLDHVLTFTKTEEEAEELFLSNLEEANIETPLNYGT